MFQDRKANAALAASLLFLLLSSCAAYFAFSRLDTSEKWVRHTREVQSTLARFSMTTSRAGRLRAEFVATGDLSLLPRYAEETEKLRGLVRSVRNMVSDNPRQQAECERLSQLSENRIAVMDNSIALKRSGNSTLAAQEALTSEIMLRAEDTDVLLQQMYNSEDQLLNERESRVSSSAATTSAVLITSLFLTLVLFLIHNQLLKDQVTARTRAENTQRALSARLMSLQDQERRKFARELHDSVGQHLAAMKMAISLLQKKLPNDPIVKDCLHLLDTSIAETRTISHLLHPPLLDEAGLNSAVRWFVEGFAQRSGIRITVDIQESEQRFSESTELVLFRVLQESLTNVHRHSGATEAQVYLGTQGNHVVLEVTDNGRGLPGELLDVLNQDGTAGGVGLAGMTERVREIGGRLDITSEATGTKILVRVPKSTRVQYQNVAPDPAQEAVG